MLNEIKQTQHNDWNMAGDYINHNNIIRVVEIKSELITIIIKCNRQT